MTPILYILMRNDMASMNAGKGMAQASHASNAFVDHITRKEGDNHRDYEAFSEWEQATPQGFGTVLVLEVSEQQMLTGVQVAKSLDLVSGVVHDPTYPIQDGDVTHYVPVDTCAYIFGNKYDCLPVVQNFNLHP